MPVNITSGAVATGVLYLVSGTQSVTYSGVTYLPGQSFRGLSGIRAFTYSGTGTQLVYEVFEIRGEAVEFAVNSSGDNSSGNIMLLSGSIEYAQSGADRATEDTMRVPGFSIEYLHSGKDFIVPDTTAWKGFALELLDYPLYAFEITETRL
jgi:hypothetical protein